VSLLFPIHEEPVEIGIEVPRFRRCRFGARDDLPLHRIPRGLRVDAARHEHGARLNRALLGAVKLRALAVDDDAHVVERRRNRPRDLDGLKGLEPGVATACRDMARDDLVYRLRACIRHGDDG
jgi:hypothetical protein